MASLSIVNQLTAHDKKSMLCDSSASRSSHDYIGEERRYVITEEIEKINPFNKNRNKVVFFDKSRGSPFSGLNMKKVDKFVDRNRGNFKRNFHEKLL